MPIAARITDKHTCPLSNGPVPHVGGVVVTGSSTVIIDSSPAARVTDLAVCVGVFDVISTGSSSVSFDGLPAARKDDRTVHGGQLLTGSASVQIGGHSVCPADSAIADAIKRITDPGWFQRDDVAREIVGKLSNDDIRALPAATRNSLLAALLDGWRSNADEDAIHKIYQSKGMDPSFAAHDSRLTQALAARLNADRTIVDAKADWASLTEAERLDVLQRVSDHQSEVYGTPKVEVTSFSEAPKDGSITMGYHRHNAGKLWINVHSDSNIDDFDLSVGTMTHESGHLYQYHLADAIDDGTIVPGDPLYDQALTFKLNSEYYVQPDVDFDLYASQPMEQHSREIQKHMKLAVP